MAFKVPEQYRIRDSKYGSDERYGNNGAFRVPLTVDERRVVLWVIASDGADWEHVSVSHTAREPYWSEMEAIKQLFWGKESTVMQLHPPRSQWVNCHPRCLHLWRPISAEIPLPPSILVGY